MGVIDQGAGAVGHKVAAALTGTFMGVWLSYGFLHPISDRIVFHAAPNLTYYKVL